ncbi:PorV/PorQ family protein [Candidatus Poribacteria bacterium]
MCRKSAGAAIGTIILCLSALMAHGAFEDIGMGARPLGMGSAFVASADGASAIFWNPAGVVQTAHRELIMSYVELYELVSYSSLGYAHRMKVGSIGFGVVSSNDGDGVYQETTLALSGAREIYSGLNVGANIKYLFSVANTGDIRIGGGKGLALDLGSQYHIWNDAVFLGASLQNLISHVSYDRETVKDIPGQEYSEGLDISYKLGAGVSLGNLLAQTQNAIVAVEFSDGYAHAGAEYTFWDIIAVRAGVRTGNALTRAITTGFGLRLSAFRLDYAYVGSEVGAQTSQFSLSIDW